MHTKFRTLGRGALAALFAINAAGLVAPDRAAADSHEMNPCSARSLNPCAGKQANPCAGKNPCAMKNPCAGTNPCAMKNPCAGNNPCAGGAVVNPCRFKQPAGFKSGGGDRAALAARGAKLWDDTSLSTNGASCGTCHQGGAQFQPTFSAAYPHEVAMVKQMSGVSEVSAAEMIQFCMLQPMQSEPLAWNSPELAALTAHVVQTQKSYAANPCAMKNPCSAKNPCAMKNPCAAKNPCGMKNPCGGN